jgi:hypothetical protein
MTEKKTKLQKLKDLGLLGAIKTDKKTLYRNLEEKGLIGFLSDECTEKGCRNLETRCLDCDRVVNTAQFGAIECNSEQSGDECDCDICERHAKEAEEKLKLDLKKGKSDKSLEPFTGSLEGDQNLKNDEYALDMLRRELFPRNYTTLD